MRKNIFVLLISLSISSLSAQIGISTETPLTLFHIDPLSNTNSAVPSTYTDDVVFTDGKLGLGIINPDKSLDLKNSFRFSDGNEATDYVLYVDDQKNIGWEKEKPVYPPLVSVPATTIETALTAFSFPNNSVNTYRYSGLNITLTQGVWLIYLKTSFSTWWNVNTSGNVRALLCSSSTGNGLSTSEGAITAVASTNGGFSYFSGYIFVSVISTSKTFYLWFGYISGKTVINGPVYDVSRASGLNSFYALRYSL
ncbi:hypothetical protein [Dysgonomonas macrotermitis]|uniref:Uncharacterized protein n=1 Tax=Dysgonomonas macrotermitis TaxID=1346286 RepID=A0A1M5ILM5_9BACT|nr:hypothetical protein [Dysgonomonas macrotermitis]SHG28820.1 hypothetical protein SAMN05444362_12022 [Dysgonomonas macrotermitis]